MQTEETTEDLLTIEHDLVRAEAGKRLLNYIVDVIIFYILAVIVGVIIAIASPSTITEMSVGTGSSFISNILSLLFYGLYMSLVEAIFKGKSLGKLITGTRAVNLDGSRISAGTAFARGFSRAVPFCVFSALGSPCNPWQDKWTDTMVIDERKSALN